MKKLSNSSLGTITEPSEINLYSPKEPLDSDKQTTKTESSGIKPKMKKSEADTISNRVLVISPYQQLNLFFELEIPRIYLKTEVDVVSYADFNKPPYINVELRESGQQKPLFIIDFQKIIAEVPSPEYLIDNWAYILTELFSEYTDFEKARERLLENFNVVTRSLQSPESSVKSITQKISESLKMRLSELELKLIETFKNVPLDKYVLDVVKFLEYNEWRKRKKIDYVTPTSEFSEKLESMHQYDEEGNFTPVNISISEFIGTLKTDLTEILHNRQPTKLLKKST